MKLNVTFSSKDRSFTPGFGQVHNISDGGYERGCAETLSKRTELVAEANGEYVPEGESTGFKRVVVATQDSAINRAMGTKYDLTPGHFVGVTQIVSGAFQYDKYLQSVSLPDGVTSIGTDAFKECTALKSVTLPDSITRIFSNAFYQCSALSEVVLPKNLTSIYANAFYNCSSLKSINIPDSVTTIGDYVFGYSGLTDIPVMRGMTSIPTYCFYYCNNLTEVTIPDNITQIGDYVFCRCNKLVSITLPDSITKLGGYVFMHCEKLTDVKLPSGLTSIPDNCFYGCYALKDVTIPEGVTSIGKSAFYETSLYALKLPDGLTTISDGAFQKGYAGYCGPNFKYIVIPQSVTSMGNSVFNRMETAVVEMRAQTPPTLSGSTWSSRPAYTRIVVPAGCADAYKAATNWSSWSSIIIEKTGVVGWWRFNDTITALPALKKVTFVVTLVHSATNTSISKCEFLESRTSNNGVDHKLCNRATENTYYTPSIMYDSVTGWKNEVYRYMYFYAGDDLDDEEFLAWLNANATKVDDYEP